MGGAVDCPLLNSGCTAGRAAARLITCNRVRWYGLGLVFLCVFAQVSAFAVLRRGRRDEVRDDSGVEFAAADVWQLPVRSWQKIRVLAPPQNTRFREEVADNARLTPSPARALAFFSAADRAWRPVLRRRRPADPASDPFPSRAC